MENNNRSPAGLHSTWNPLDCSSSPGGNSTVDEQAYDIGAAADYNAGLFKEKNDDIDEQGYDIGAAADYNAGLLKRKNHEIDELASLASLNTPLRSDLHAIMPLPEVQAYMPIDFNASDRNVPNEIFPAEPNVMASMASNISEQFPPTSFVNHEEIAGQIATAPLLSPSPQKESGATDGSIKVSLERLKGRWICGLSGCNKTFPRRYELRRHVRNIHTQDFRVVCPVYGCHRTTKPFNREDKFMEHFRKHDSLRSYRRLIESCQSAPFDIPGLIDHLAMKHYMDHKTQNNLGFTTGRVLDIHFIPFWFGVLSSNGGDICPLAPIGCTYRITADVGENCYIRKMAMHIFTHKLSHRLQLKENLRNFFTGGNKLYLDDGTKNCMLCSFQSIGHFCHEILLDHIAKDHSKEERSSVLGEVSRIIERFVDSSGYVLPEGEPPSSMLLVNECSAAGFKFLPGHYCL
ncbi:hypothetical protein BCIN_03g08780 [Botrytis cinerea B05.10]|uniref:C2H2-type domain-containing protein n=1 Tax=Botryotinia fuckeliana (strain B05.10) TaxID=332648 RepID=A0A384JDS4_BOTFB|nr:hypothetical protein BCIN_03g08780 [Botrytis cinerea B05.10]ATZ48693.1 hypothetical protein BCIN_03g08780 [Botrytis cinerea B05.10]